MALHPTPPATRQLNMRLRLPNGAQSVSLARGLVRCALKSLDVSSDCAYDITLAVSEACTNVLDHAGVTGDYEISAGFDGDRCVLEVSDEGSGFIGAVPLARQAALDAESGRGMAIIEALVDRVEFSPGARRGVVVRMEKELVYRAA